MRVRISARSSIVAMLVACAAVMAACGGGAPTAAKSPPPGPGDFAICNVIAKATAAYSAKQYPAWRLDLAQIGTMASSAHDLAIKRYADELKAAYDSPTTTVPTTRPVTRTKGTKRSKGVVNTGKLEYLFAGLGGYVGIKDTCAKLHR